MTVHLANLLYGILSLASLVVWWRVLLRWRMGEQPLPFRERPDVPLDLPTVLAVLLVWFLVPVATIHSLDMTQEPSLHNVQVSCISGGLSVLAMGVTLLITGGYRPREIGIRADRWRDDLRAGGLGFLAAFAPVVLVLLATAPLRSEETIHSFLQVLQRHPSAAAICWIVAAAVVSAPLVEELLFRVVLQGALTPQLGAKWAIPLVAAAFCRVHDFPDSLPLFPLALMLGYVYHRTHSYLAVVVLHAAFNATNLIFALLSAGGEG